MTYTLHFLPEVEKDVINGYIWYDSKSPGLGEEFLRMFYACAGDIPRNPMLYSEIHREIRRHLLRRFPYAIYFVIKNSRIIVLGLFHCARDPRIVHNNLQDRESRRRKQ